MSNFNFLKQYVILPGTVITSDAKMDVIFLNLMLK